MDQGGGHPSDARRLRPHLAPAQAVASGPGGGAVDQEALLFRRASMRFCTYVPCSV